jgi:hypothetical protein
MFNLHLTRGGHREGVHLGFPASPGEVGEAFAWLDSISTDAASTKVLDVACTVGNLEKYIINTDFSAQDTIEKLNLLAEKLKGMGAQEQQIFSGALDAESINGLDDVLSIAGNLDAYTFLPNVCSDRELGIFLVETGYLDFPQHLQQYINYASVGAEYYTNFGGAYSPFGYVRRRDAEPKLDTDRKAVFTAHLQAGDRQCVLKLPATDAWLDTARRRLQVDEFCEMELTGLECAIPYLEGLLPRDCISVVDADKLALEIEGMMETDGDLMKYLSALCVEESSTFQEALEIAYHIGDYERIAEGTYEYGQSVLRRIGADEEVIDTIDGYMDFERFGEAMMAEDGVRQTEFGLIRRLNEPFPSEQQGQIFQ